MHDKPDRSDKGKYRPGSTPSASPDVQSNNPSDVDAGNVAPPTGVSARELNELQRLLVERVQDYAIFALDPQSVRVAHSRARRKP